MCDHDQATPHNFRLSQHPHPVEGSRRRRLWDLSRDTHCPVVGVCIPLAILRRLINKAVGAEAQADDYEIHVGAIAECAYRNRISDILQNELEHRYALKIKSFRSAKTPAALTQLWLDAIRQGDVAGAFWAGLTHPQCTPNLQEGMCRDMHMLQHQAGATVRTDLMRFNALVEENAVLGRELARVQERSNRLMQEKVQEIAKLEKILLQLRAENIGKESVIFYLNSDIYTLKASVPDFESRHRLQQKVNAMASRQTELENQLREFKQKLAAVQKSTVELDQKENAVELVPSKNDLVEPKKPRTITLHLEQRNVLCVGGRSGNVASYRDLIERVGGRFAHHDGGLEDKQNLLDHSLAAADLVICQTACISHNAYWRVKEFCKRTGKRCVFVENPSVTSLARGLEMISEEKEIN